MEALKRWFLPWLGGRARARKHGPRCLCCGRCCDLFGGHLQASKADLQRWKSLGRDDILRRVSGVGWLWMDPETGRLADRCPFLRKTGDGRASCAIHDVKPEICRAYPTLAHGRRCVRGMVFGWAAVLTWANEIDLAFGILVS